MSLSQRSLPLGLCIALMAASLVHLGLAFEALPPKMASHFNGAGVANGFEPKTTFAFTTVALYAFMLSLFAALPWLMARLPTQLINLPNRDYWLAPERKQQTLARAAVFLDWFGLSTIGLLVATFELVLRANLRGAALESTAMNALLVLYLALTVVWCVSLLSAFRLRQP